MVGKHQPQGNFQQKNRAEHGAAICEEKQTLLCKTRENLAI